MSKNITEMTYTPIKVLIPIYAFQSTLEYLIPASNWSPHIPRANEKYKVKTTLPLSKAFDLKDPYFVCTEIALLAQYFFQVYGLKSYIVKGVADLYGYEHPKYPEYSREGHDFLIINDEGLNYLYDPTNPLFFQDKTTAPAIKKISEEELQHIFTGNLYVDFFNVRTSGRFYSTP